MVKVALCQFTPCLKDVAESQRRAESLLSGLDESSAVDILVLPEMAFTGYVFDSVDDIAPFLEDSENGPSVTWAKQWAKRLRAYVIVGYPQLDRATGKRYNSICVVAPDQTVEATYQKHFLYETDELWAEEGPAFRAIRLAHLPQVGTVGLGICMDVNPYQFKAAWSAFEYANFHTEHKSDLLLLSMAWLKSETWQPYDLMRYWINRLKPLVQRPVKMVVCNRLGTEKGSTFAGTSCAIDLGKVAVVDNLADEAGLLLVDL